MKKIKRSLVKIVRKEYHKHPYTFFGLSAVCILLGIFLLWISSFTLPDLSSFEQRKVAESTKIYDRTGTVVLFDVYNGAKRTMIPLENISPLIQKATIAIEDNEFYTHRGIKITSIIRAVLANLVGGGYAQGGSTITQQVVKNSLLTQDKKISRKLKEWVLALKIEKVLSKEQILSIYLNETSYGGTVYGVEQASQTFFGKKASEVTLAESAYLAAIPQATTFFSPYGKNLQKLEERKNLVLRRMVENGFITTEEENRALQEKVVFKPQENFGIKAPHFSLFVKSILEQKYGKDMVENGGLKVTTTLDNNLQQKAEELVKAKALENKEKFNAENAALIALNPKNGEILSMVGSRDYFDKEIEGNFNITTAKRQPGSTFKPIVYAEAFTKGLTPDTVLFDLETEFSSACDTEGKPLNPTASSSVCYKPGNYDNKFRGPISLREALAQSINIPAIKTLYLAGIPDSLLLAKSMGITSLTDADQYGLTLVLGGGEVSLLEMTNAYSVFANDGIYTPYNAILSIEDKNGNILYKKESSASYQVLDKEVSRQISDILSDNNARAPAYGRNSALVIPGYDVAVKTGTTNDYKDVWTIGYSPTVVVGVWAGNNNNTSMEKKVAGQIIAPLWNDAMRYAVTLFPKENFKNPEPINTETKPILRGVWKGGETYIIDTVSGKRATSLTPDETKEEKVIQNIHSILYWINKNDIQGPKPEDPTKDAQFERWEAPIRKWAEENGLKDETTDVIPKEEDDVHTEKNMPELHISGLQNNQVISSSEPISFSVSNKKRYSLKKIIISINGNYITETENTSSLITIPLDSIPTLKERNILTISAIDSVYNKSQIDITFLVSDN